MTLYLVLVGAVLLAVLGVWAIVYQFRFRRIVREERRQELEAWTEMARTRGFELEKRGDELVIRGTVAGRSFEIGGGHFFTYGMDSEIALHFQVENEGVLFAVTRWNAGLNLGLLQPRVGDEAFDALLQVRANDPGLRWITRIGPNERRLLVDHPDLSLVHWGENVWIRLPYRIQPADLDAACQLVARVWGVPPNGEGSIR